MIKMNSPRNEQHKSDIIRIKAPVMAEIMILAAEWGRKYLAEGLRSSLASLQFILR
jgi:hypothetical protein